MPEPLQDGNHVPAAKLHYASDTAAKNKSLYISQKAAERRCHAKPHALAWGHETHIEIERRRRAPMVVISVLILYMRQNPTR